MINVGDTVHVTDDALKMSGGKHRKEFKVTKISRDSFGNQWIYGDAPFEIWNATELEECTLKYKVGDKVVVREWDDMAKEYGVNDDGNILVGGRLYFNSGMRVFCGKTVTIVAIKETKHNGPRYKVDGDGNPYHFIDEMLKPAQSTVTIAFSGDTTIATDGEHTATVTKYHGDEYSEETGAIEAIKKLYHRFPQKGSEYFIVRLNRKKGVDVGQNTLDDDDIDNDFRKSGNFYETKAAAQKVADKINAIFKEEH